MFGAERLGMGVVWMIGGLAGGSVGRPRIQEGILLIRRNREAEVASFCSEGREDADADVLKAAAWLAARDRGTSPSGDT